MVLENAKQYIMDKKPMAPIGLRTHPASSALQNARLPVRTVPEQIEQERKWKAATSDLIHCLLAECTKEQLAFLKDFVFKTPEEILAIRALPQRSVPWKQARIGRVTMSNAGRYLMHNPYNQDEEESIHEAVFSEFKGNVYTEHGQRFEPDARRQYVAQEQTKVAQLIQEAREYGHTTFQYADRVFPAYFPAGSPIPDTPENWFRVTFDDATDGLSISENYNWLACSPDGIIWIMNEAVGCLEIKCPASQPLQCYPLCPIYYMDQMQGQMMFLNVTFCHFYVWTPTAFTMDKVEFDLDYCYGTLVRRLTEFYFQRLLPALAANRDILVERALTAQEEEVVPPKETKKRKTASSSSSSGAPKRQRKPAAKKMPPQRNKLQFINSDS